MEALLQVADFKSNFSEVLSHVRRGEEVVLSFGRKKEKIAVLMPYDKYRRKFARVKTRKAGSLATRGSAVFTSDFKMTDAEFLRS